MSRRLLRRVRTTIRPYPKGAEELKGSTLYNQWWYYSIELLPGLVASGAYPPDLPMLPRLMLRRCALENTSCLDLGSMEGLVPVLMCRGGAKEVLATDAVDHCVEKMETVKHYHKVDFDYKSVGLMYGLHEKLSGRGFDLINCSGLLYHVFSPLTLLSGIRPLLKKNGLIIVSTNVILDDSFSMEFNNEGRMQVEANTFWYISIRLLDYVLRYFRLAPIDCLYVPHTAFKSEVRYVFAKPSGYASVLCRAADTVLPAAGDEWMAASAGRSWEYKGLSDWEMAERQPASDIKYKGRVGRESFRPDVECIDLWEFIKSSGPVMSAAGESDSHILRLSDKT